MFGAPALLIRVGVKAPIATDPVCGVDIHFADQIRQPAITGNHAVLAGLNFTKVSTGFNLAEVHPTATTWFQGLRLEAVEEFRALACTRQPDGISESVVFNDKDITLGGKTIQDVGLGYISLGQQSTTLSGGEAQRIKLATELSKIDTGNTFYILDEPTTGLHFEDIRVLMIVLNKLVDKGNTVLVIEHNLDVIKMVDHIIDIGPEGGKRGGNIIFEGKPEDIVKNYTSYTGQFLKKELN